MFYVLSFKFYRSCNRGFTVTYRDGLAYTVTTTPPSQEVRRWTAL